MDNEFVDARRRLQELAHADHEWERLLRSRCDWDDPEDVLELRRQTRFEERIRVLDRVVPNRICPGCNHLILSSRSWVLSKQNKAVLCRSCWFRQFPSAKETVTMDVTLFPGQIVRYSLDHRALGRARARSGLSARAFARRAGWTEGYQRKLESSSSSVTEDTAKIILQVLREASVVTKDVVQ